jgi:hypothetical protein
LFKVDWGSWRIYLMIQLAAAILALALPLVIGSEEHRGIVEMPRCEILVATGHPCATCGITRSLHSLYRGDFAKSRTYHPLGWIVALGLVLNLIWRGFLFLVPRRQHREWFMVTDLTLWVVLMVVVRVWFGMVRA